MLPRVDRIYSQANSAPTRTWAWACRGVAAVTTLNPPVHPPCALTRASDPPPPPPPPPRPPAGWGVLDLAVVALGFLNLLPGANNLTAVRAFRVLRPLRAVPRLRNLKVGPCRAQGRAVVPRTCDAMPEHALGRRPRSPPPCSSTWQLKAPLVTPQALVVTLLTALPMLMHVVVLAALVYFAYGIVGVQAFEGVLRYT